MQCAPIRIGKKCYESIDQKIITSCDATLQLSLSVSNGIVFNKIIQKTRSSHQEIKEICELRWEKIFINAGCKLEEIIKENNYFLEFEKAITSCIKFSGLPKERVISSLKSIEKDLKRVSEIISANRYGLLKECFRDGFTGENFMLIPAGKNLMIDLPGNSPTIHINWLIPLMLRRPVIVVASQDDPLLAHVIANLLYDAGLPDGAFSLLYDAGVDMYGKADQVMLSGTPKPEILVNCKSVKTYHHGRSKLILDSVDYANYIPRIDRACTMGGGRLCTNFSGILLTQKKIEKSFSIDLAEKFLSYEMDGLFGNGGTIPAFGNLGVAERVNTYIDLLISRGAIDMTEQIAKTLQKNRLIKYEGYTYLRPTVLLAPEGFVDFGVELPFPFVIVMVIKKEDIAEVVAGSLIVSAISNDIDLISKIVEHPRIDKLYLNDSFDIGYTPLDPHEGLLSDFLFKKKAYRDEGDKYGVKRN